MRKDNNKSTYGSTIDEMTFMFPEGCEGWGISLDAFIEQK